jgi:hypothetical protein
MKANARQIGGSHYGGGEYQYWDFAHDVGMGYLMGHAGKYMRYRKKHGLADLEKCLHFIDKCEEVGVDALVMTETRMRAFERYISENDVTVAEGTVIRCLMLAQWKAARLTVKSLIESYWDRLGANFVPAAPPP